MSLYCPRARQGIKRILHSKNQRSLSIKLVGVEIDLMSLLITHDKVALPSIITGNILVPPCFEQCTQFRDRCGLSTDVDICLKTRLSTQPSTAAPATLNTPL